MIISIIIPAIAAIFAAFFLIVFGIIIFLSFDK